MEKLRRLLETYSPVSRDYPRHMKLSKTSFRHYFTTTSIGLTLARDQNHKISLQISALTVTDGMQHHSVKAVVCIIVLF